MKRAIIVRTGALSLLASACLAGATPAYSYTFQTLNNPADLNFNALLGINDAGTIAGVYGGGDAAPGHGYTLVPPSAYTPEDFPGADSTAVSSINNSGTTVGFWEDGSRNTFGFYNQGSAYTSVSDPNTPTTGVAFNRLIDVNDSNTAAGFYLDSAGNPHGYTYDIGANTFTPVTLPPGFNAVGVVATGVNNSNDISGVYITAAGVFGFLEVGGTFYSLSDPNGTTTQALGLNNVGDVIGSFVDKNDETQGFLYDWMTQTWQTISNPLASATSVCFPGNPCVDGTTVFGVNDERDLVGFFSDGVHVNGFLATVPEPSTWAMMLVGFAGLGFAALRRSNRGGVAALA